MGIRNLQFQHFLLTSFSDLEPGVASGEGLGHLEEPAPCILLQVHVVLLVILVHHLGIEALDVEAILLSVTIMMVN